MSPASQPEPQVGGVAYRDLVRDLVMRAPVRAADRVAVRAAARAAVRLRIREESREGRDGRRWLEEVLSAAGKNREQLLLDLEAAHERKRLAIVSASIPELETQCAIANEGYRLIREATRKARAEADAREQRARQIWTVLRGRLDGAQGAKTRLEDLLPEELCARWNQAEDRTRQVREMYERARREKKSTEHLEAALEYAEEAWRQVQREALVW